MNWIWAQKLGLEVKTVRMPFIEWTKKWTWKKRHTKICRITSSSRRSHLEVCRCWKFYRIYLLYILLTYFKLWTCSATDIWFSIRFRCCFAYCPNFEKKPATAAAAAQKTHTYTPRTNRNVSYSKRAIKSRWRLDKTNTWKWRVCKLFVYWNFKLS